MGISTDGILFYGFPIKDQSDIHHRIDDDHDDISKLMKSGKSDNNVSIGIHCSGEYPMYYIYTNEYRAWRGTPQEVNFKEESFWRKSLRQFCSKHEIPWQEPKWWLVSYLG